MNEVMAVGVMVGVKVEVGEAVGNGVMVGSSTTGTSVVCMGVGV